MKKISKLTLNRVLSLCTLMHNLDLNCINDEMHDKLAQLESEPNFDLLINTAFEDFSNLSEINHSSFKQIIQDTLDNMTDKEIMMIFKECYFSNSDWENADFIRELLHHLQIRFFK